MSPRQERSRQRLLGVGFGLHQHSAPGQSIQYPPSEGRPGLGCCSPKRVVGRLGSCRLPGEEAAEIGLKPPSEEVAREIPTVIKDTLLEGLLIIEIPWRRFSLSQEEYPFFGVPIAVARTDDRPWTVRGNTPNIVPSACENLLIL